MGNCNFLSRVGTFHPPAKDQVASLSWNGAAFIDTSSFNPLLPPSSPHSHRLPTQHPDIKSLAWSRGQKHSMLSVQRVDGSFLGFTGFRDGDATTLASALSRPVPEQAQATLGHNWGDAAADGAGLTFSVGGGPAFRLPLTDVVQAQAVREEVMLEFPADDAAAGEHVDALTEVSFYLPTAPAPAAAEAGEAGGDEVTEAPSAARALLQAVLPYTDAGAATGDAITSFDQVAVIVPRGRFDVEMYASSLKLLGQAQDFRVAYDTILRIFVLPKTNVPQTLVVISLDPPIRQEGLGVWV